MKIKLLAAALLLGTANFGHAADEVVIVDSAYNWSGVYVGAQAGYGWGDADDNYPPNATLESDADIEGGFVGIYGGYNWQFGNIVTGVDADINYSGIDGTGTNLVPEFLDTGLNWTATIRGRLGYAIDRMLIYGAGGVAFADVDVDISNGGGTFASASDTLTGWTIGAGAEYAFSSNLIGRFEYRYTDYGSIDYTANADGSVDFTVNSLAIGVAYKF